MTKFIRQTPCAVLLAVQFLGVLLYPFLEASLQGRQLFAIFGVVVLGLAVYAVRATPGLTWVAGLLALPAVVLLAIQVVTENHSLVPWAAVFEAVLYVYAGVAMIRYMLDDEEVTTDELFAIGAVFTLFAWAFAHVYIVLQAIDPASFGGTAFSPRSVDRTALPVLHRAVEHRLVRHRPDHRPCPQRRHDRAGRRPVLHRHGGHAAD